MNVKAVIEDTQQRVNCDFPLEQWAIGKGNSMGIFI